MHNLRALCSGALQRGMDVTAILERAGLAADLFDHRHGRVTQRQFARVLVGLRRALDDERFGLGPRPFKPGTFAVMCQLVLSCSGLRAALQRSAAFYDLFPPGSWFRLDEQDLPEPLAAVEIDTAALSPAGTILTQSSALVIHRFASWLIGVRIPLERAEFAHARPPHGSEYELYLGCPCRFDAPRSRIVLPRRYLDLPVTRNDDDLRKFLARAMFELLAMPDDTDSTGARVRLILKRGLPHELPDLDEVAARLSTSPQSLRRRLHAEETSFRKVRDQLRRDIAVAELAHGNASIADLADRLGFSEPSAFHRAFRRWTGSTPRMYHRRSATPPSREVIRRAPDDARRTAGERECGWPSPMTPRNDPAGPAAR